MDVSVRVAELAAQLSPQRVTELQTVATEFEAVFLQEMLKTTQLNATSEEFGGGEGEDAFGSMLTQQYADLMSKRGGIGISEHIFRAMASREVGE